MEYKKVEIRIKIKQSHRKSKINKKRRTDNFKIGINGNKN